MKDPGERAKEHRRGECAVRLARRSTYFHNPKSNTADAMDEDKSSSDNKAEEPTSPTPTNRTEYPGSPTKRSMKAD
jgi:hypothetical protein